MTKAAKQKWWRHINRCDYLVIAAIQCIVLIEIEPAGFIPLACAGTVWLWLVFTGALKWARYLDRTQTYRQPRSTRSGKQPS